MCPSRVPLRIVSLWVARIIMQDHRTLFSIRSTRQIILVPIIIMAGFPMPMILLHLLAIRLVRCALPAPGKCHAPLRYRCPLCPYTAVMVVVWRIHWMHCHHHHRLHHVHIYSSHVLVRPLIRISRRRLRRNMPCPHSMWALVRPWCDVVSDDRVHSWRRPISLTL